MNNKKLTNYVKKLAVLTASTVGGTALLAALAQQVKAATFSYVSEWGNSTWEIETPGDSEIPESWDGSNISSIRATFEGGYEYFEGGDVIVWPAASFDFFQDGSLWATFEGGYEYFEGPAASFDFFQDGSVLDGRGDVLRLVGFVSIPSEDTEGVFRYEFEWDMEYDSFYIASSFFGSSCYGSGRWGCIGPRDRWTREDWTRVTSVPEPTAGLAALSVLGLGAVATRRQRRTPSRR